MLSVRNLSYNLNENKLFNKLSITLFSSCILYIKGSNGCGKTTLLRIIAGIQKPQGGEILYNSVITNDLPKPYCNYIAHLNSNKSELTVFENLKFWSKVYNSLELLESSIHYFNLHNILDKKYYELSAGNKRKVSLARLLACQSDLWLLDEIDTNLDEVNKALLYNLIISKANNGGIILISSHNQENFIKTASEIDVGDYR